MRRYPVKVASKGGPTQSGSRTRPRSRPRTCEDHTREFAALRCAESHVDFLGLAREGSLAPPARLSAYTMQRHLWSILPTALTIFLAHGVALAQDVRCGGAVRR